MQQALQASGTSADAVDYINAHGTSTHFNDLCESIAIEKVFGTRSFPVSSTKGVTGHCLGAAGGIEAIFLAKTLETQIIPPTAHLEEPDEGCRLDYVPKVAREGKMKIALSNSFGFGGTNATIVMKKA
jgi:3-oxoacyl-[acyl-carrier-protein] synthase II